MRQHTAHTLGVHSLSKTTSSRNCKIVYQNNRKAMAEFCFIKIKWFCFDKRLSILSNTQLESWLAQLIGRLVCLPWLYSYHGWEIPSAITNSFQVEGNAFIMQDAIACCWRPNNPCSKRVKLRIAPIYTWILTSQVLTWTLAAWRRQKLPVVKEMLILDAVCFLTKYRKSTHKWGIP